MNICILTKSTLSHQMGGMEVHAQTLSELAIELGHSVTVITTRHPEGIEFEENNGISFHYLIDTRTSRYSKYWWKESAKKILQLHNKNRFDVIWAESFSGYYYACKVKPLINIPIISIMQGGGIIGVIKSGWSSISSFKEFFNFMGKYLPESIFLSLPLFWKTLKYSDVIVAVSNETAKSIQREFFIDPKKISVIYNGVDTDVFKPDENKRMTIRNKYSLSDETKVIIMAGIVHRQKGMHIGLKAFTQIKKEVPNCKMIIVGNGPQLDSLKNLANNLNIEDDVIFCGFVSNKDTSFYYNAADLFLNPTVRVEGLPIVIVEALACGLPSVVTCIGGVKSTINDGVSGFFVEPGNVNMLVEKSIEILNNPDLMVKFSRNARQKAVNEFNRDIMINNYLKVSKGLV